MRSQRQPDSVDVIGGGNVALAFPAGPAPGRGGQNGGRVRLGRGQCQAPASLRARPLAQPLRVGPGFIRAKFHTSGQGVGEHERGGGLEFAAEQIGGAGRLEAQGPPVLATGADLGEFYLASRLLAQLPGARLDAVRWPGGTG